MNALVPFDFHGDALSCIEQDGRLWVAVKPVCAALGLADQAQATKLKAKPWAGTTMIVAPSRGGPQEMFCVDLDSLPMWLATIEPARVRKEARPKLVIYQKECARVLRDHFFGRRPAAPAFDPALLVQALARVLEPMEERIRRLEDRPVTPAQKRAAAREALERAPHLSDRELARRAGVGKTLLREVRAEIGADAGPRMGHDNKVRRLPTKTTAPTPAAAELLSRLGLVVQRNMTTPKKPGKKPVPVWNVTGTRPEWAPILRGLGGRWYRPEQHWTFFVDPSEEMARAFEAEGVTP